MMCSMLNSTSGLVCHATGFYFKITDDDITHCVDCGLTFCQRHAENHICNHTYPARSVSEPIHNRILKRSHKRSLYVANRRHRSPRTTSN